MVDLEQILRVALNNENVKTLEDNSVSMEYEPFRKPYWILSASRCLKITEKVSFNIASEASYVYILSGQKSIKNGQFDELLKT